MLKYRSSLVPLDKQTRKVSCLMPWYQQSWLDAFGEVSFIVVFGAVTMRTPVAR